MSLKPCPKCFHPTELKYKFCIECGYKLIPNSATEIDKKNNTQAPGHLEEMFMEFVKIDESKYQEYQIELDSHMRELKNVREKLKIKNPNLTESKGDDVIESEEIEIIKTKIKSITAKSEDLFNDFNFVLKYCNDNGYYPTLAL